MQYTHQFVFHISLKHKQLTLVFFLDIPFSVHEIAVAPYHLLQ